MNGDASPATVRQRLLRVVSRCDTVDGFVAAFRGVCDGDSIFIATRHPKPVGTRQPVAITLADGTPVLAGTGEVVEAYGDGGGPGGRPGMRLRLSDLGAEGRALLRRLAGGGGASGPPPSGASPTARVRDDGDGAARGRDVPARVGPAPIAGADAGPAAPPRESLVLPANPLSDLPDESLVGFIECTLYEESGFSPAAPSDGARSPAAGDEPPPAAPGAEDAAARPDWWPPARPPHVRAATPPVVRQLADRAPPAGTPSWPEVVGAPPEAGAQTSLVIRTGPPAWRTAVVAGSVSAVVAFAVAYAMWGRRAPVFTEPERAAAARGAGDEAADPPRAAGAAPSAAGEGAAAAARPRAVAPGVAEPAARATASSAAGSDAMPAVEPPAGASGAAARAGAGGAAARLGDAVARNPAGVADAAAARCALRVDTRPAGVAVQVAGARAGVTPAALDVPCGHVSVRLSHPRYAPVARTVAVEPDRPAVLSVSMQRPRHKLVVTSKPPGATVQVGGRRVGRTPVTVTVPGFQKTTVEVVKPGYRRWRRRIYSRSPRQRITAALRRAPGGRDGR